MNKLIKMLTACVLAALMLVSFAGCGEEGSSANSGGDSEFLHSLIKINEDGNEFAGIWTITEGVGSKLDGFYFMFDGYKHSYILVGNMGYISTYTIKTEAIEGGVNQKTMTTRHVFGLNGSYTYSFDDDKQTVSLRNVDTGDLTVMKKTTDYDCIPSPDKKAVIDEVLVGAWRDENGNAYYFDTNGIMLEYNVGMSFTFANYTTSGDSLSYTYTMKDEVKNESQYSVEGDSLTLDGIKYSRIPAEELSIK